ncbi:hypothetical protein [Ethanoligenens harbinense]|uniref:hypothetical protein n=1 Tax=Ethanoligenens harbinense TaxID=253239 RepID=UPI000320D8DF|nr:hypothetical protein [Ethanoligenens harbinense]
MEHVRSFQSDANGVANPHQFRRHGTNSIHEHLCGRFTVRHPGKLFLCEIRDNTHKHSGHRDD